MFESFFYRSREAFLLVDENSKIIDANLAACRFLFREREELAGLPMSYVFAEDALWELFRTAGQIDSWTPAFNSSLQGEQSKVDLRAIRLHPSGGGLLYAVEVSRESEQREIFRQLRVDLFEAQARARAERKVSRELEFANNKLTSFAHRVAHDIRNPLRNIRMALELNRQDPEEAITDNGNELLDIAEKSASELELLVDGLLDYSKRRDIELNKNDVALNDLVQSAAQSVDDASHGLWLRVGSLPVVRGDGMLLDIVFQNLLSNSMKFASRQRPLRVEVSAHGEGEFAAIRINDNGIGFEPEAAERIFELFNRENHDREGVGIGLATCAELIANHGWRIEAEGAPDDGTVFTIIIPWSDVVRLRQPEVDEQQPEARQA
ncbi:ATP-binding protein [Ponticaulis sp.]|uniref:sensor histidine kinase n=1 Tax=Ponticaulis sp. TaxID=2020902 RepID=UPI000B6C192F|nr:ATP-binding protein [Ponticaulis sp.]MAI91609.1 hypothetical protein [Ponticaulis sp.]OUX97179.1 MAG: hypothetical protein CBB65_14305 [Hyphomonadaceae bacterium TMED5]|tara:strand:- start:53 stop:1189 length:1137 start_codon:yes stop_codon:yes gene_type:complete